MAGAAIEPESIRTLAAQMLREITRPGFTGEFSLKVQSRQGVIYAIDKELKETFRAAKAA